MWTRTEEKDCDKSHTPPTRPSLENCIQLTEHQTIAALLCGVRRIFVSLLRDKHVTASGAHHDANRSRSTSHIKKTRPPSHKNTREKNSSWSCSSVFEIETSIFSDAQPNNHTTNTFALNVRCYGDLKPSCTNVRRGCDRKHTTRDNIPSCAIPQRETLSSCAIPQSTPRGTFPAEQFRKDENYSEPCNRRNEKSIELCNSAKKDIRAAQFRK